MSEQETASSTEEEFFELIPEDDRPWAVQKLTGMLRFARRRPLGFFGGVIVVIFLVIATFFNVAGSFRSISAIVRRSLSFTLLDPFGGNRLCR